MKKNMDIYVVEDDQDIAELVKINLDMEGFYVKVFHDGESAYKALKTKKPDLIILDIMLPGLDGLEVCRLLKQNEKFSMLPIILLSARGEEKDIVKGLELGADDYITKPFKPSILIARVKAVFRRFTRAGNSPSDVLSIGGITIHPGRHEVLAGDESLQLTATEFQIIHFLARKPGWVFTRNQIVDAIRGENYAVTERSIDVQIVGLRKKLGDFGHLIETVRGVGYKFKEN